MPTPAAATAATRATQIAAQISKKIPRGTLVRAAKELGISEEGEGRAKKIALPSFLFLLCLSVIIDLKDFVELILGIGPLLAFFFGMFLSFILWVTHLALGVRFSAFVVKIILTLGLVVDSLPVISLLPLNVATTVIVYILVNTQAVKRVADVVTRADRQKQHRLTQKVREIILQSP